MEQQNSRPNESEENADELSISGTHTKRRYTKPCSRCSREVLSLYNLPENELPLCKLCLAREQEEFNAIFNY